MLPNPSLCFKRVGGYLYDTNGNMTGDKNKGITMQYNHLNLPTVITKGNEALQYGYDATGVKQTKTFGSTTTTYTPLAVYKSDSLEFVHTPEGYFEPKDGGFIHTYQYKDHLGNNRLSFADSNGNGKIDTPYSSGVPVWEDDFEDKSTANGDWNGSGNSWGWPISDIVNDKAHSGTKSGMLQNTTGTHREIAAHSNEWIPINNSKPTLYRYSGWVYVESGAWSADIYFFMKTATETNYYTKFDYVQTATKGKWVYMEKVVMVPKHIAKINLRIDNNGTSNAKVWFDDLKIEKLDMSKNEIVSETNFYPFGLEHKGYNEHISSSNLGQNYKFNGKELNDEFGLNFTDFGWRNYMSDIGRWISPDPLMEEYPEWSPYNFTMNNPVRYIDPDGLSVQRWEDRPEILAQKARIETAMEEYYGIEDNASNESKSSENKTASTTTTNEDCCDTKFDIAIAQRTADAKGEDIVAMQNDYMTALEENELIQASGMVGAELMMAAVPVAKGLKIAGNLKVPVYRVYGGGAGRFGKSWTFVNPKLYGNSYRNFAGLPTNGIRANSGNFMIRGSVRINNISGFKMASPLHGNSGKLVPELLINNSWNTIRWSPKGVSRVKF